MTTDTNQAKKLARYKRSFGARFARLVGLWKPYYLPLDITLDELTQRLEILKKATEMCSGYYYRLYTDLTSEQAQFVFMRIAPVHKEEQAVILGTIETGEAGQLYGITLRAFPSSSLVTTLLFLISLSIISSVVYQLYFGSFAQARWLVGIVLIVTLQCLDWINAQQNETLEVFQKAVASKQA